MRRIARAAYQLGGRLVDKPYEPRPVRSMAGSETIHRAIGTTTVTHVKPRVSATLLTKRDRLAGNRRAVTTWPSPKLECTLTIRSPVSTRSRLRYGRRRAVTRQPRPPQLRLRARGATTHSPQARWRRPCRWQGSSRRLVPALSARRARRFA